jgi:hypothetical protein
MKKELTFEESLSGLLGCGNPDSFRLGFFHLIVLKIIESLEIYLTIQLTVTLKCYYFD